MAKRKLNLLSLDGGGVRGLSSLMILQHLMKSIDPDAETPPKPCEYFDMIGGTSTGGLIAIMLGRLRMSVDECIDAYIKLSGEVFQKKHYFPVTVSGKVQARFDSEALKAAIQRIVANSDPSKDGDLLLFDKSSSSCRVFVCATSNQLALETVCLTSYRNPRQLGDLLGITKIWEAGRATSAASTFFDRIAIGPNEEEFVDGASGANNPVRELWTEASDVWREYGPLHENINCLVSVGTGVPGTQPFGDGMVEVMKALKDISLETEKTAKKFSQEHYQLRQDGRYFRFSVVKGLEDIGLEHADKKKEIAAATRAYIKEMGEEMENCYNNLRQRETFHQTRKKLHSFPTSDSALDVSRNFVERPETLQKISDSFEKVPPNLHQQSKPHTVVVQGLAGSGKSQIARRFARLWLERDKSFYWFDASSSSTLDRSFYCFARDVSIIDGTASTSNDPTYIRKLVCDWIVRYGEQWLLVFDNYDIMELNEGEYYDLQKYFPMNSDGHILITTRNREVESVTGGTLIDIGTMTEQEAITLFVMSAHLQQPAQNSDEWEVLREIACGLLGSYPLALAQGGSYLRLGYKRDSPLLYKLQSYKKQYALHEASILKGEDGTKIKEYGQSVITTWDMSFEVVVCNNTAAAELLLLSGFFHHTAITTDVFARAFERRAKMQEADGIDLSSPEFSWLGKLLAPNLEGSWDQDFYFDAALSLLQNYSLIQRTTGEAWNVHPLVHLWTIIGKQHPHLSPLRDRARLAFSMLGGMHDASADSASLKVHEMRVKLSNHITSAVRTVERHTEILDLRLRSPVKAATLLRVENLLSEEIQSIEQKAQRLSTRIILQALVNGSVQDGIDHISTLQSLRAVIIDFNSHFEFHVEGIEELLKVPIELLPLTAMNDAKVELESQQLSFQVTYLNVLRYSHQEEKHLALIKECIAFADAHELEIDDAYRLRCKGALLGVLASPQQLKIQSETFKRQVLKKLEDFHKESQQILGKSHKTVVEAQISKASIYRELGEYDRCVELLNDLISLCRRYPQTLAHPLKSCLILVTGTAQRRKQPVDEFEAFKELVELSSRTYGPFHPETIGYKLSVYDSLTRRSSSGNKYNPMVFGTDKWEGRDDTVYKPIGLALAYKFFGDRTEIASLWAGVIEHAQQEETPGVGIDDFVYAFEITAEESKRSSFREASAIIQRHVNKIKGLKKNVTQSLGVSKNALLISLRDFWFLVDSIGPFASPAQLNLFGGPSRSVNEESNQNIHPPHITRSIGLRLWSGQRMFDYEHGPTDNEKKQFLGQSIISKLWNAPSHAKPYMLFMCIHSLELYYYGDKTRTSPPLDARSINFLVNMATKELGDNNTLIFRLHFVNAVTCQLLDLESRRVTSEDYIMKYRLEDIANPGSKISLSASAIFERLNMEYMKRRWYKLSVRMYEYTLQKLSISMGWCAEHSMHTIWFLLESYWRDEGEIKVLAALRDLEALYQRTEQKWRESFFVRMRQGGQFLLERGLPKPSTLVLRQVLTWTDTFPNDKLDPSFMAHTWRLLSEGYSALGDEDSALECECKADSIKLL